MFCILAISADVTLGVFGLNNAGKSTLAAALSGGDISEVIPTQGFDNVNFAWKKRSVKLLDLGGGKDFRKLWVHYIAESYAVIYVVDMSDVDRFSEARNEFEKLLSQKLVAGKPVLVLANKEDKPCATLDEVKDRLRIEDVVNENECVCVVESCSAKKGTGKKMDKTIASSIDWLLDAIDSQRDKLEERIKADVDRQKEIQDEEKKKKFAAAKAKKEARKRAARRARGQPSDEETEEEDSEEGSDPFVSAQDAVAAASLQEAKPRSGGRLTLEPIANGDTPRRKRSKKNKNEVVTRADVHTPEDELHNSEEEVVQKSGRRSKLTKQKDYFEDDDDEEPIVPKSGRKKKAQYPDDDEEEEERAPKLKSKKKKPPQDNAAFDDDDRLLGRRRKSRDSDEQPTSGRRSKKKSPRPKEESEEDSDHGEGFLHPNKRPASSNRVSTRAHTPPPPDDDSGHDSGSEVVSFSKRTSPRPGETRVKSGRASVSRTISSMGGDIREEDEPEETPRRSHKKKARRRIQQDEEDGAEPEHDSIAPLSNPLISGSSSRPSLFPLKPLEPIVPPELEEDHDNPSSGGRRRGKKKKRRGKVAPVDDPEPQDSGAGDVASEVESKPPRDFRKKRPRRAPVEEEEEEEEQEEDEDDHPLSKLRDLADHAEALQDSGAIDALSQHFGRRGPNSDEGAVL